MKVRFLMIAFVLLFACGKKEEKLQKKKKLKKLKLFRWFFKKCKIL